MSLFESASLVVTPNGTKASKLYAIKPTDGSGDLTVTRATTARRINSAGLIESVASNVPRLNYLNSTCPSVLVEPQRTNVITYSEDFSNVTWVKAAIGGANIPVVTANDTISPDGNLTADKVVFPVINLGQSTVLLYSFVSLASSYNTSFYMKGLLGTEIIWVTFTKNGVNFSTKICNLTTNWQRFDLSALLTAGVDNILIGVDTRNTVQTARPAQTVFIWGAQLELGSDSTSYIPTTTATVTRNADVISKTLVSSLIGQTEGTIYAEIKVSKLLGTASRYIFHLSDGTANNRIYMAFSGSSSNILRARIFNGGTLQCSIDSSTISAIGTYKLALAYKNNDIAFYINGVQIGTDTSATIPTCSRVDLGQNYAGASQLSDNISLSTLFKTRLTNAELATLTTI